jgi:hypothetical protein
MRKLLAIVSRGWPASRPLPATIRSKARRRTVVLVVLGFGVCLAVRTASAKCPRPTTAISPKPGSSVPRNPTLYVFARSADERISASADGEVLPIHVTHAKSMPPFSALRVAIQTGAHSSFVLRVDSLPTAARFIIDPSLVPERTAPNVAAIRYVRSRRPASGVRLPEIFHAA